MSARESTPIQRVSLENQPHTQLCLPRIAQTTLHCTVEVEKQAGGFRMLRVRAIRQVEHVDDGLHSNAFRDLEVLVGAEVDGKKRIVLPQRVALDDVAVGQNAVIHRLRLRRMEADQRREFDSPGSFPKSKGVEAVALVPIGKTI